MATECGAAQLDFRSVEARAVVAAFDCGRVKSDAAAFLVSAADDHGLEVDDKMIYNLYENYSNPGRK